MIAAGLLACGTLLAAGCGGDDEGIPSGDVSKAEYISRADAICAKGDAEISAAAEQRFGDKPPSNDQVSAFIEDTVVPNIQGQLDRLRELEAPEADLDQVEQIYDTAQENLDVLAEAPEDFVDEEPFAEANKLARGYGLRQCGS